MDHQPNDEENEEADKWRAAVLGDDVLLSRKRASDTKSFARLSDCPIAKPCSKRKSCTGQRSEEEAKLQQAMFIADLHSLPSRNQ